MLADIAAGSLGPACPWARISDVLKVTQPAQDGGRTRMQSSCLIALHLHHLPQWADNSLFDLLWDYATAGLDNCSSQGNKLKKTSLSDIIIATFTTGIITRFHLHTTRSEAVLFMLGEDKHGLPS